MTPASKRSALAQYRSKRDPAKTPEPMGSAKETDEGGVERLIFVIQEHHATALHWDLRLARDGVLVSWALPKGVPLDPRTNHLAIATEDHPLEYRSFEGEIPKGEYGGGHVTLWDQGEYELESWTDREVKFVMHGSRVDGRYALFATGGKNWMIHRMDPLPEGYEPAPVSVSPMLARSGELPLDDRGWAYEFKWDGIRAIVSVESGRAKAHTRNGNDVTGSFPELRSLGEFFGAVPVVLDGEIVAFDDSGRPDFGRLAHRLHLSSSHEVRRRAAQSPATFLAFDLLYIDGVDLTPLPYDDRRARLEALAFAGETFATPPAFANVAGKGVVQTARERGLEGVVAKDRRAPYRPGMRTGEWIKIKLFRTQEVVIGGWTEGNGARSGTFGALLLGVYDNEGVLGYVGKVGTGFGARSRRELLEELRRIESRSSPFPTGIDAVRGVAVHFVVPEIVGEVQFGEWTTNGRLRQLSWRGLRPDKAAKEIVREP